jgi:hypothetical protein
MFMVAVSAAKKITAPYREGGESEAWISIAFSMIALESFMNETLDYCGIYARFGEKYPIVSLFVQVMSVLESRKASLEDKYSVAHSLLVGKPADFASQPYQDMRLLIALRNELVHFKPTAPLSRSEDYHPVRETLRAKLRAKNVLAEKPENAESWIFHVGTRATAEWACKTAASVIVGFFEIAGGLSPYLPGTREFYAHNFF